MDLVTIADTGDARTPAGFTEERPTIWSQIENSYKDRIAELEDALKAVKATQPSKGLEELQKEHERIRKGHDAGANLDYLWGRVLYGEFHKPDVVIQSAGEDASVPVGPTPAASKDPSPAVASEWPKWVEDTVNPIPWKWLRFDGPDDLGHKIDASGKECGRGDSHFPDWTPSSRFVVQFTEPSIIREYREKHEQTPEIAQLRQRLAEFEESNKFLDENNRITSQELRESKRESEQLRQRVAEMETGIATGAQCKHCCRRQTARLAELETKLSAVTTERDASAKDAERLDYLTKNYARFMRWPHGSWGIWIDPVYRNFTTLREAIDAAMAKERV